MVVARSPGGYGAHPSRPRIRGDVTPKESAAAQAVENRPKSSENYILTRKPARAPRGTLGTPTSKRTKSEQHPPGLSSAKSQGQRENKFSLALAFCSSKFMSILRDLSFHQAHCLINESEGIFVYDVDSSSAFKSTDLPWPICFLLGSFNRKHLFPYNPPLSGMYQSLAQWKRKRLWQLHLGDTPHGQCKKSRPERKIFLSGLDFLHWLHVPTVPPHSLREAEKSA